MKRYVCGLLLIFSCVYSYAASNQEIFLRGNKAYQEGAYQEALEYYNQIANKGNAVWHNMGNCCYKLQRPVDACVYWQRARKYAACDDYCALDTQLALLDVEVCEGKKSILDSLIFWLRAHTASYSLLLIQLLTLLIWFSLCLGLRRRMHWGINLLLCIMSCFLIWLSIDMQMQRCRNYAVTIEETPVFVGPNTAYHQQGVVTQAHTVNIMNEREGWYKIAYKGLAGWVQADKLVKV